ncbi:MAG TPA: hypothetical protein VFF16_20350 [Telluria sp.]|nr:hypothetical protein [Telluria sp.]
MRRTALVVLALAVGAAGAAPFRPATGTQVLEVLPARATPQQQELRRLRTALAAAPNDAGRAAAVARAWIELGRSESDPRYFGYAQAALAPWWRVPAPPPEVRLLRAVLLQTNHHFTDALADLDALTLADPGNVQAWLTRATVQTVRADYAGALHSCGRVSALADPLVSTACLANVASLTGRLEASERLLALTFARSGVTDAALVAWVQTMLAEMAVRRGDAAVAERRFRQALRAAPGDAYLLGAYADFLLDQGRSAQVAELLSSHLRVDGLLLRYAIALKRTRSDELPGVLRELDARFDAARQRGDSIHQREQARLLLELQAAPVEALRVAQKNWDIQKEPADARILLEAARAARDRAAARPVLGWMKSHGVEDKALSALAAALGGGA